MTDMLNFLLSATFSLISLNMEICAQSFILANDKQEKNDLKMLQMKISPHMYE